MSQPTHRHIYVYNNNSSTLHCRDCLECLSARTKLPRFSYYIPSCIYSSQGDSCCVKPIAILQLTVHVCRLEMSLYWEIPWVWRVPWEWYENRIRYTLILRKWDWEGMITCICRKLWGLLQMTTQTISLWLFVSVRHCLLWHWMRILCSLVINRRSRWFEVIDFVAIESPYMTSY